MSPGAALLERFRHEALLYSGEEAFVNGVLPFLHEGIAADEPILVVESRQKIGLLRSRLQGEADHVMFADMADVGANPARIIPAWHEFVGRFGVSGRRLRGIGEPIWEGRPEDELAEAQRHEALLNVAFGDGQPWWLLCPYDTGVMHPSVVEEAGRSHEFLREADGTSRLSESFVGAAAGAPFEGPMAEPAAGVHHIVFGVDTLINLRKEVLRFSLDHGMAARRAALFVTALNEIATNSIVHGGGSGRLRMWPQGDRIVAEIQDSGQFDHPLADRRRPGSSAIDPRGLWVANQFCDLVQIRRVTDGTAYRLHMKIDGSEPEPEDEPQRA